MKVNVDNHKQAAMQYNVRGIPNLILFSGGELQEQIVGAVDKKELLKALTKVIPA